MYIKEIKIQNIRSIENFEMKFEDGEEAGWHVLLGDNGTGKTTIAKSISLGLVGPRELLRIIGDWKTWLTLGKKFSRIEMAVRKHIDDKCILPWHGNNSFPDETIIPYSIEIDYSMSAQWAGVQIINEEESDRSIFGSRQGWFSIGVGPFRRFSGGNLEYGRNFPEHSKGLNHITLFKEDALLAEAEVWLKDLHYKHLEKNGNKGEFQEFSILKKFINNTHLLPRNIQLESINSDGLFIINENEVKHHLYDLSDGVKSVLSLVLELFRVLFKTFNNDFLSEKDDYPVIETKGVVLIDEVDAHLHPTWQTRIGDWFTKYFPNMQFIVTTHSPLICRGAKKGTIWKLPNPGEMQGVQKITGLEKDKLVYGDILDAYSTEAFGKDIERSELGREKLKEFSQLSKKKAYGGNLTEGEQAEYDSLKGVFSNDAIY